MWCIPFIKTLVSLKTSFLKKFKFKKKKQTNKRGVTFHSLLVETHSLLVTCCKTTRYSLQNSLVTRCRSCSLQKITRYSLQNLLVTRCRSCLLHWKRNSTTGAFLWTFANFKNTYSVKNQRTAASENNIKILTNFLQFFTSSFLLWFKFDWIVTDLFD